MKFRTRSGVIRLGSPSGHVHTLTEEWQALDERFHKEAYAAGCLSEDMVAAIQLLEAHGGEPPLQGDAARLEKAKAAIRRMLEGDNPADFTAAGIPDLRRLRALADFDVTADERDAAWETVSETL
jgi:hypothetical protein